MGKKKKQQHTMVALTPMLLKVPLVEIKVLGSGIKIYEFLLVHMVAWALIDFFFFFLVFFLEDTCLVYLSGMSWGTNEYCGWSVENGKIISLMYLCIYPHSSSNKKEQDLFCLFTCLRQTYYAAQISLEFLCSRNWPPTCGPFPCLSLMLRLWVRATMAGLK